MTGYKANANHWCKESYQMFENLQQAEQWTLLQVPLQVVSGTIANVIQMIGGR